uniref:Uncharacterized protein n=1 Tax=Hucho hucho TaxID=62062 RepID=A0A4W5NS05_9TELE
ILALNARSQKLRPCSTVADGSIMTNGRFTYDSLGQKVHSRNSGMHGNKTFVIDLLMLFREEECKKHNWAFHIVITGRDRIYMIYKTLPSTFSEFGCLPLTSMVHKAGGCTVVSLYNILLGIQDPMDFVPPFFCKAVLQGETGEAGDFFNYDNRSWTG